MASLITSATSTASELTTIDGIRARYDLPGPHATVVLDVPTPGSVGDDLGVRWSVTEADLLHLGATSEAICHMGDLLESTHRRGQSVLLTANDENAACCWLSFDIHPSNTVAALPALAPALHEAGLGAAPTVGAAIDRTGADVYRVGTSDIERVTTIEGEGELVRRNAAGRWLRARRQGHREVLLERTAALIAAGIAIKADRLATTGIVLTGDEREVALVKAQLDNGRARTVLCAHAGGRHEPDTSERIRTAALAFRSDRDQQRTDRALDDLREELGQQDRAVAGAVEVLEAITENRVKTLLVDRVIGGRAPHVDAIIRAALAHGADLVVGHDFDVRDGIGAILRVAYR